MNKLQAEELVRDLDEYARSVCRYEFGLPTWDNNCDGMQDHMANMIEIVLKSFEERKQ